MRRSTSTRFLHVSPGSLRTVSWISSNLNIHIAPFASHPRYYATKSSKGDPNRKIPWVHYIALELSALMLPPKQGPKSLQGRRTNSYSRWAHYTTLGLWRDASQEQIKQKYYELSRKHHPDVSNDPNSAEAFGRVTEAYAVLGNKKTRRKYDQREQLHSAIMSSLIADESNKDLPSSIPRPVDPTYWDPVRLGSSTFYRPPRGYWTLRNQIRRDMEKSNTQKASPPHTNTQPPPHDKAEANGSNQTKVNLPAIFTMGLVICFVWKGQEWILRCIRDFLVRLKEASENESSALQREDPTSQARAQSRPSQGSGAIAESQAQLGDT